MNFFEAQRRSKRQTLKLYWLFGCAIFFITMTLNLSMMMVIPDKFVDAAKVMEREGVSSDELNLPSLYEVMIQGDWALLRWDLVAMISVFFAAFLLGCSLFYGWAKRGMQGDTIALELGARLIAPVNLDTQDTSGETAETDLPALKQRQLLNVVEEMCLAAAIPVLPVYVLQRGKAKTAINGFAAGTKPQNSVLVVTEGALIHLNRQEMQALVAHEISHIIHGDTLINIKLIGVIFGLTFLASTGEFLLRLGTNSRGESRRKNNSSFAPLVFLGLQFWLIGQLGALLGRMIKASIARERELLADATAVQFTRDISGLASLLQKIQTLKSEIDHPLTGKYAHMMIAPAEGVKFWGVDFGSIFQFKPLATHPTIEVRLGHIGVKSAQSDRHTSLAANKMRKKQTNVSSKDDTKKAALTHDFGLAIVGMVTHAFSSETIKNNVESYGNQDLKQFARCPYLGRGLLAVILGVMDHGERQEKLELIKAFDKSLEPYLDRMWDAISQMTKRQDIFPIDDFLGLIEIGAGSLRSLSDVQKKKLVELIVKLTMVDKKLSLPEFFVTALIYHEFDFDMPWRRSQDTGGSPAIARKNQWAKPDKILRTLEQCLDLWKKSLYRVDKDIKEIPQGLAQAFDIQALIIAIESLVQGPQLQKMEILRQLALKMAFECGQNPGETAGLEAFLRLVGILVDVPLGRGGALEALGIKRDEWPTTSPKAA